jgi:alpha-aminoadipate carrier protein LysW
MKVVPREQFVALFVLPNWKDEERFSLLADLFIVEIEEEHTMAHCPECEASINLQGLMVGEIIYCPDCNAELEVLNLEQPEVALAPQVEEDWGE